MKPIVHGLEAEYADRLNFIYLDIDDPATADLKRALNYRVQPHYVLLDSEGNVLQQWFGRVERDQFVQAFDAALQ